MKICVYGVGAVGGFIGAQLSQIGCKVSAVARGDTLEALRRHGLRAQGKEGLVSASVQATADPATLGLQDLIVIAVKGPALAHVAERIALLLGPDTIVLTAMNGVPWWFFEGFGGPYAGTRLRCVDPDGTIAAAIPSRHVVGCVVYGNYAAIEPGFVRNVAGNRLVIGESDGKDSERVRRLATLFTNAGFEIEVSRLIQADIWYKLWGNMTVNPVSAITGATCDRILDDPLVYRFCLEAMAEAARIGDKIGCPIKESGEERMALAREMGAFKTSMLQDVEAGKPVELDALVSAVREIGEQVGVPTPNIDTLLGLARLHARVRGLYPADLLKVHSTC